MSEFVGAYSRRITTTLAKPAQPSNLDGPEVQHGCGDAWDPAPKRQARAVTDTVPRNFLRGMGVFNMDTALRKSFRMRECGELLLCGVFLSVEPRHLRTTADQCQFNLEFQRDQWRRWSPQVTTGRPAKILTAASAGRPELRTVFQKRRTLTAGDYSSPLLYLAAISESGMG